MSPDRFSAQSARGVKPGPVGPGEAGGRAKALRAGETLRLSFSAPRLPSPTLDLPGPGGQAPFPGR